MTYRESHIFGLDSQGFHKIVYSDWGAPEAHPVLCVHGLTCNGHDFDDLSRALAEDGYRVIAVDLPGRGRSDPLKNPLDYHLGQYCQDIAALLAHLGISPPTPPQAGGRKGGIDWIGVSLGGLLGICLAAMENSPIRRMIVNDIAPEIPKELLDFLYQVVLKPRRFDTLQDLKNDMRGVQRAGWGPLTEEQWQAMAEHYARALEDGALTYNFDPQIGFNFAPERAQAVDLWPLWERIAIPTLLIRGGQSLLLTHAQAEAMAQRAPRAGVQTVTFDDCGHAPSLLAPAHIDVVKQWLNSAPM